MVLPPEESLDSETVIDSLIDTSDTGSFTGDHVDSTRNGTVSPDALIERYSIYKFIICVVVSFFFFVFLPYINRNIRSIRYLSNDS